MGTRALSKFDERLGVNRVGVVAALPAEYRTVRAVCRAADGALAVCAGVGADRAVQAAESLLDGGVTALLSWGCAGALVSELAPGSLVVPQSVVGADGAQILVDRAWHGRLCGKLHEAFRVHTGKIAESSGVLVDPAAKSVLASRSGAVAVDMESAALGRIASERGVAFAVVRAVADSARQLLPDGLVAALDEEGRVRPSVLLSGMGFRLRRWGRLWSAARVYREACASLRRAAIIAVPVTPWGSEQERQREPQASPRHGTG